ncbi:unnamed protein product, partial [Gulo gulo]
MRRWVPWGAFSSRLCIKSIARRSPSSGAFSQRPCCRCLSKCGFHQAAPSQTDSG